MISNHFFEFHSVGNFGIIVVLTNYPICLYTPYFSCNPEENSATASNHIKLVSWNNPFQFLFEEGDMTPSC